MTPDDDPRQLSRSLSNPRDQSTGRAVESAIGRFQHPRMPFIRFYRIYLANLVVNPVLAAMRLTKEFMGGRPRAAAGDLPRPGAGHRPRPRPRPDPRRRPRPRRAGGGPLGPLIAGLWSGEHDGAGGRGTGPSSVFREYAFPMRENQREIPAALSRNITRKGQKLLLVWNIDEG
jgi:hypothetical protein